LAVLIIASEKGDEAGNAIAAMLPFVGQTLLEYQVRLARAAGGGHIVVLVEQLPAAMIALFDRLRADGIDVDIAREPRDAADKIHPEEQVLLFSPGFVGSREIVESLAVRSKPTLLTISDEPAHALFERIDAAERWSGLALLSGQSIRETAAMLGDWSISSTLMRTALQSGAERWRLEQPDSFAIISNAHQAEAMSAALVRNIGETDQSPLDDLIIQPLAKLITPYLLKWSAPLGLVAVIPFVLLAAALLLALLGWFATGFALFCLVSLVERIASTLLRVSARSDGSLALFKQAKPFGFYILLLLLGWEVSGAIGNWGPLVLAGWGSSILLLRDQKDSALLKWQATIETGSLLMLFAMLFAAPIMGLLFIVGHGFAGQIADRFLRS
jgi:hypothetical protein